MWKQIILAGCIFIGTAAAAKAQGFVDQEAAAPVLETQGQAGTAAQSVSWHVYHFNKTDKTTKASLARLQAHLDSLPGGMQGHRMTIVELSNRVRRQYMLQRHELLIPDAFPEDFRAYAPYPQEYAGAAALPKLFVIDKYTQTFGAYENGRLVRWGLVSTGAEDERTPTGRYAFNWRQEYRESSEAPEGEVWKLRWVFNINARRGIHLHQYQLPIAMPASHGCVRLTESDAYWNFNWADQWNMSNGSMQKAGTPVIVVNHSPVGMAAHWMSGNHSALSLVSLPTDPMEVPMVTETAQVAGR